MKYEIRFNHTSPKFAASKSAALKMVATEARCQARCWQSARLRHVDGCDGEYIYLSIASMQADADGSRAFAVISATD